jgi:hypothetical protein
MARRSSGISLDRTGVILLCSAAVIVGRPAMAWASCPLRTICDAYDRAAMVFVADVQSVQPAAGPTRARVLTHVRHLLVEQFKGSSGGAVDLALHPSSEEFSYVIGQRAASS